MADLSDVEQALVACVLAALYPAGIDAGSPTGSMCRVFRGWPVSAQLAADLSRGTANVSVFSLPGGRTTTRWPAEDSVLPATPALQVAVTGNSATFSGAVSAGQLAGVLISDKGYVYRTRDGDTLGTLLAGLRDVLQADRTVVIRGATLTLPDLTEVVARTGSDTALLRELRRQEKRVRISIWSGSPDQRDAVSAAVDVAFAAIDFLPLADGSVARLRSDGGTVLDNQEEAAGLYRRDLVIVVEYATTMTIVQPQMLFGCLSVNDTVSVS
jgi:hypothetical protein